MKKMYALPVCFCMIMLACTSYAQSGSTSVGVTIAGGNGFGTAINQIDPRIVALDTSDNLYVLDSYAARIFKFAPGATQGTIITGGTGPGAGIFAIDATNNFYVSAGGNRILKWAPGATEPTVVANIAGVDLRGLAADAAGNVYALDFYGNRVLKYPPGSTTGVVIINGTQLYAGGVSTNFPAAISIDAPGNIYISDDYNGRILKYNQQLGTTAIVAGGNAPGGAANQLSTPRGTFVDAAGNLYIADGGNSRIQKWAPGATAGVTVVGGNGSGTGPTQLAFPWAVCVDKGGRIYVADYGGLRVQRFDVLEVPGSPALGVTVAGGDGSMLVSGVHVDRSGNIYVADEANHRIQKFAPGSLKGTTVAGGNGAGPAANQLNTPKAVFVDSAGNVYIADAVNNRVQKWAPGASAGVTVAGGNGLGNDYSQLAYPNDVYVDKQGKVYVCEYDNDRVTVWSPGATKGGQWALRGFPGYHPTGLFGDSTGFVYVSVSEDADVSQWNNNNNLGIIAGGRFGATPGSAANELLSPAGLFVDIAKTLYVADKGNHRIQRWVQGAQSGVTIAGGNGPGNGPTQLSSPNDVFLDQAGNMYVASGDRVQKFIFSGDGAGINYKYYEGTWNTLPDFSTLTPVKTGISTNLNLNYRTQGRNDNYAFLWEGKIKIPTAGLYTFETVSDDGSRLYFNKQYSAGAVPTVDNDGVHAAKSATGSVTVASPGVYPIAISFFQKDQAQTMQVYWTGPGVSRQPIPDSAFVSMNAEDLPPTIPQIHSISKGFTYVNLNWSEAIDNIGVTGYDVYVDGVKKYTTTEPGITVEGLQPNTLYKFSVKAFDLAGNRSAFSVEQAVTTYANTGGLVYKIYSSTGNALPDFARQQIGISGYSPNVDINVRPPGYRDHYAFVWEGYIHIQTPGLYTFETRSDDGSKLYFNSLLVPTAVATVNNDGEHAVTSATGSVYIPAAGAYPVAITYFQNDGDANMQVYWSGPGIAKQLIPDIAFNPAAPPPYGLDFSYYEGTWDYIPYFGSLTPVLSGVSPNVDISIRPAGKKDHFAFLWQGSINIPAPGTYTFETVSDDGSKLYFNSLFDPGIPALVDNEGLHPSTSATGTVYIPEAGNYPVAIGYFQKDGGANMQVYWSGPGIPRQLIPNGYFGPYVSHYSGIKYKFYQGSWTALPDFNALTPVKSGNTPNFDMISVRPAGVDDHFALLWEGMINVPYAGYYTFETISDDGSKLYFNQRYSATAVPLVNNDGLHGAYPATGTVYVPAPGAYPITVSYFEREGNESFQAFWSGPGVKKQLIPEYVFTQPLPPLSTVSGLSATAMESGKPGPDEIKGATRINKVYPDPFVDRFSIDFYNASASNDIIITVRDLTGRLVHTHHAGKLTAGNNSLTVLLNSVSLSRGMYFVTLSVNGIAGKVMSLVKTNR